MKNYLILLTTVFCMFSSCQGGESQGEPILWSVFALIETEDGTDYFDANPGYTFEKYKGCWPHNIESDCLPVVNYPETYSIIEGYHVFDIGRSGEVERLLDFGNGDIDTVKFDYLPRNVRPNDNLSNVEYIDVYYNGSRIYRFDFENNAPSRLDLFQRNSGYPSFPDDPIIIPIVKKHPEVEEGN